MIGLGTLAKLKKGGIGPDELAELLAAVGIVGSFTAVPLDQALPEFQKLAKATSLPSASLVRLSMVMKDGQRLDGLLVMTKAHNGQ